MKLSKKDIELVKRTKKLIFKRKNKKSSVACCLITMEGKIFEGINIFIKKSAPCSMCAEYVAIGSMFTEGNYKIDCIVSVHQKNGVIPPCGQCRQLISSFGNPYIILGDIKLKLSEIYIFQYK